MKKSDTGSEQLSCKTKSTCGAKIESTSRAKLGSTSGAKPAAIGTPIAALSQLPFGRGGIESDLTLADDKEEPERYRVVQDDD